LRLTEAGVDHAVCRTPRSRLARNLGGAYQTLLDTLLLHNLRHNHLFYQSMTTARTRIAAEQPQKVSEARLFGVPVGDFGWFSSLLIGFALGFAAFFAATFLGIFFILFYNTLGHHTGSSAIDYAYSYRRIGLPTGVLVAVAALGYLATLWVKRKLRRA